MPSSTRKVIFANDQIYHVYNRGVEKRQTFLNKNDYHRAIETLNYYRYMNTPKKFSDYLNLSCDVRSDYFENIHLQLHNHVEIIAYCLMPNHFHLLIKQKEEHGITQFMTKFTNSYTKYFNTRYKRVGPLFQGIFKAVHIDSQDVLLHVCRYIHLNPVVAYMITIDELDSYPWTSHKEYMDNSVKSFCASSIIKDSFTTRAAYKQFIQDQVSYAHQLNTFKHLTFDEV